MGAEIFIRISLTEGGPLAGHKIVLPHDLSAGQRRRLVQFLARCARSAQEWLAEELKGRVHVD